ncbi:dna repair protein rhp54 [Hordeum vulgare]|nr:dna repair protein rhp54 [Hordeum vulgare]
MRADMLTRARNLFDGMSTTVDDDTTNRFLENMIFECGVQAVVLEGFPLEHEFLVYYVLEEEEDDMDIDGEPLFEEELANQTVVGAKPKGKSKRTNTYTPAEDKFLCECWRDIGQDPKCDKFCVTYESIKACPVSGLSLQDMVFQALEAFKVQQTTRPSMSPIVGLSSRGWRSSRHNMPPLLACGGKEAMEDHRDGEKARPRGKTKSKKEDRRDAELITLLEKVEGMMRKRDLREEKHKQEKEEQMNAFMEIQRRRVDMDAER